MALNPGSANALFGGASQLSQNFTSAEGRVAVMRDAQANLAHAHALGAFARLRVQGRWSGRLPGGRVTSMLYPRTAFAPARASAFMFAFSFAAKRPA